MTKQTSMAQQIANITNSVKALEILQQLRDTTIVAPVLTIVQIKVVLSDGTEQTFIKETAATAISAPVEIVTPLSYGLKNAQYGPKPGKACIIDGVKFISIVAAGLHHNLERGRVSARIKSDYFPTWNYA